jgi:hypothetical protein
MPDEAKRTEGMAGLEEFPQSVQRKLQISTMIHREESVRFLTVRE